VSGAIVGAPTGLAAGLAEIVIFAPIVVIYVFAIRPRRRSISMLL
jgi:hypothetical protein